MPAAIPIALAAAASYGSAAIAAGSLVISGTALAGVVFSTGLAVVSSRVAGASKQCGPLPIVSAIASNEERSP